MLALGPKELLQGSRRAGHIRDREGRAREAAWPGTAGDLAAVHEGGGQRARCGLRACHGSQQIAHAAPAGCPCQRRRVVQEVRDLRTPVIPHAHIGPPGGGFCHVSLKEGRPSA